MNFSNRNKKTKIYTKDSVVVIVRQKAKTETLSLQGIIDYKNLFLLRKFITAEGKILPRRISGLNAKQQRYIAKAIKNARMVGLLPFINHSKHPRI